MLLLFNIYDSILYVFKTYCLKDDNFKKENLVKIGCNKYD